MWAPFATLASSHLTTFMPLPIAKNCFTTNQPLSRNSDTPF